LREFALLAPAAALGTEECGGITRFVVGGLLISHGARPDAKVTVFFDGQDCVSFEGGSMRNVRPDEQSLSGLLRAGLKKIRNQGKGRVMQGIYAYRKPFAEYAAEAKRPKLYYSGGGGRAGGAGADFAAVFQHPRMGGDVEEMLVRNGFISLRLAEGELAPDQAVVVLNNRADRKAFSEGTLKRIAP
jgi:tRNA pseudouridine-54 N-methylase